MQTLVEYLYDRPWIPLLMVMLWLGLFFSVFRLVRGARTARWMIESQFDVMSDADIASFTRALGAGDRAKFDFLLKAVRKATGGVVRQGHLYWATNELSRGDSEPTAPPLLTPPADRPHTLRQDPGAPFFRQFMIHKAAGRPMQAYEQLMAGHRANSPICTAALATARIRGDIPGHEPDPSARSLLEQAIGLGFGYADLGFLLLDGVFLPRDVPRAIALFERALSRGWDGLEFELAMIFTTGEHVAPNAKRATDYLLSRAPAWRRKAAALGVPQHSWAQAQLTMFARARAEAAAMPGWKSQRIAQAVVSNMLGER